MRIAPASLALLLSAVVPAGAQTDAEKCNMPSSFKQADRKDLRPVVNSPDALVFSVTMRVDADGGPHTYSAKDPEGSLCDPHLHPENARKDPIALGCAMDQLCEGASVQLPSGQVLDYLSCSSMASAFRTIRDAKWQPPAGYHLLPVGIEMRKGNEPCVDADGAYIVSTSSTPSGVPSTKACDQARYIDSLVPSIVVPECWANSYRNATRDGKLIHAKRCAAVPAKGILPDVEVGDLVALSGRSTGRLSFAVIGDLGPNNKLGEASVGLLMQAADVKEVPSYVRATNALDGREQFDVVVLKHTAVGKPLTLDNIPAMSTAASDAFSHWSGTGTTAQERLKACGRVVSPPKRG